MSTGSRRPGKAATLALASAAAAALALAPGFAAGRAQAAAAPSWTCPVNGTSVGYAFEQSSDAGAHAVQEIDPAGRYTAIVAFTPQPVDAVGFNPLDHYFYGVVAADNALVRIGADGSLEPVRTLTGDVPPRGGEIDAQGHYWTVGPAGQWEEYDLVPGSPSYGTELQRGGFGLPGGLDAPEDWSWMSNGPHGTGLYGVAATIGGSLPHLVFFPTEPAYGNLDDLGPISGDIPVNEMFGSFTDGTYLYVQAHGSVYRVDLAGRFATHLLDNGFISGDGAQCGEKGVGTLHLTKEVHNRNQRDDQFKIAIFDENWTVLDSNETHDGEDAVTIGPVPVQTGRPYYLIDELRNDYFPTEPWLYQSHAECFENGAPLPLQGGPGFWEFTPHNGGDFECRIVNVGVGQSALELHKVPDLPVAQVGEVVHYHFHVVNTGETTLNFVQVHDNGTGSVMDCGLPPRGLAPGEGIDCGAAPYVVRPDDAVSGAIVNHATAMAVDNHGEHVFADTYGHVDVIRPTAEIKMEKSAEPDAVGAVGEHIRYTFRVSNPTATALDDVRVQEHWFSGSGPLTVRCPEDRIDPHGEMDCSADYVVTQQDLDEGGYLVNDATATGINPLGEQAQSEPSSANVRVDQNAGIAVEKTSVPTDVSYVGEPVRYRFTVRNTGNVGLRQIELADNRFTGHGVLSPLDCAGWDHTLAPDDTAVCTADYTVAQGDIDQGGIDNAVVVTGHTLVGSQVTNTANHSVTATRSTGLSLVKRATPATPEDFRVGQQITYTYEVVNTGNTTVVSLHIVEPEFTGHGPTQTPVCAQTSLGEGERTTCSAGYTLTQADIDQGSVINKAHATGTGPAGPTASNDASVELEGPPAIPGLEVTKSVEPTAVSAEGTEVTYSFLVANTGNTELHGVSVAENEFTGTAGPLEATCPVTSLPAGKTTTCTARYRVTQADIDAGTVTNTATAHALEPAGTPINSEPSTIVLHTSGDASLNLVKRAVPDQVQAPSDVVTYLYTVTNTGSLSVIAPRIHETAFSGSGTAPVALCPQVILAPDESTECAASYTVTSSDLAAGRISNSAHAAADRADDGTAVASGTASASVAVPLAALSLAKSASPQQAQPGDPVIYSYRVTNTGGSLLHDLRLTEGTFTGSGTPPVPVCPSAELPIGASMICKATYTVTARDAEVGHVDNTALARATAPDGSAVTSIKASASVLIKARPTPTPTTPPHTPAPSRPPHPPLPPTGAELGMAPWLAGFLALAGGSTVLLTRRRRRH